MNNNNYNFNRTTGFEGYDFDRQQGFGLIPNKFNRLGVIEPVSASIAVISVASTLLKNSKIIFQGFSHRKAAAAINALKSKGYTLQQIQASPFREIVDIIAFWNAPIKDVLQGIPYVDRVMKDAGGANLFPPPQGPTSKYSSTNDSNVAYKIVQEVYGTNFPPPGQTEGMTMDHVLAGWPPRVPVAQAVPAAQAQAVQNIVTDAAGNVMSMDSATKANIGWVVGIGILAIGAGIYFGTKK